jgi:hypothetical protein
MKRAINKCKTVPLLKILIILYACIILCACSGNTPSSDIEAQRNAEHVERLINDPLALMPAIYRKQLEPQIKSYNGKIYKGPDIDTNFILNIYSISYMLAVILFALGGSRNGLTEIGFLPNIISILLAIIYKTVIFLFFRPWYLPWHFSAMLGLATTWLLPIAIIFIFLLLGMCYHIILFVFGVISTLCSFVFNPLSNLISYLAIILGYRIAFLILIIVFLSLFGISILYLSINPLR